MSKFLDGTVKGINFRINMIAAKVTKNTKYTQKLLDVGKEIDENGLDFSVGIIVGYYSTRAVEAGIFIYASYKIFDSLFN